MITGVLSRATVFESTFTFCSVGFGLVSATVGFLLCYLRNGHSTQILDFIQTFEKKCTLG